MGALAHYFERAGIATTQVSLVREHSEKIKPPRALWCNFELGRPFGAPDEPDFQRRVLLETLNLLERTDVPILVDFPDLPLGGSDGEENLEGWACPVNFGSGVKGINAETDPTGALKQEMDLLRSWYDLSVEALRRTTVGISEVDLEELAAFIIAFSQDDTTPPPRTDLPIGQMVGLAIDDLKAYYFEAATAKPGRASDKELADWYYGETVMGKVLVELNETCRLADDDLLNAMAIRKILPAHQQHLKKTG